MKYAIASMMMMSAIAHADVNHDLQLIAEAHQPEQIAENTARIARNTLSNVFTPEPMEDYSYLPAFREHDAEKYDDLGMRRLDINDGRVRENRLIKGNVTTHFREYHADNFRRHYGETSICDYPNGGLTIEYDALNPSYFRVTGVYIDAVYSCESISWREGFDGKNVYNSRRWDSWAAWENHWNAANTAVTDTLEKTGGVVDWFMRTPLVTIPVLFLIFFFSWRIYKKKSNQ